MHFTLKVAPADHTRMCCPATAKLPKPNDAPTWRLYELGDDGQATHEVACQYGKDGELTWVIDYLDAGKPVNYLARSGSLPDASHIALNEEDGHLDFLLRGFPLTSYVYAQPVDLPEIVRPYFWPVYGPSRYKLTRDFPMEAPAELASKDHPHHRSFWVAHGDINGTDNWSEQPGHGWQIHQDFTERTGGNVYGRMVASILWTTNDRKPQLSEERTLTVYNTVNLYILDLTLALTALNEDQVFKDTKEGGLISFRVADSISVKGGGRLINSRGQAGEDVWGQPAEWVDDAGPIGGISLLDHPSNLRYPTTWHARTYGLVTANPFGWNDFNPQGGKRGDYTLPEGKTLTMRYRVLLHNEYMTPDDITRAQKDWANPPQVSVEQ